MTLIKVHVDILMVSLGILGVVLFSKKFGLHNLFILTLPISRLGPDVGFKLKPFLLFLYPLLLHALVSNRGKFKHYGFADYWRPIAAVHLGLVLSMLVSAGVNSLPVVSFRHAVFLVWLFAVVALYINRLSNLDAYAKAKESMWLASVLWSVFGIVHYLLYLLDVPNSASTRWGPGGVYKSLDFPIGRLRQFELDPSGYALNLLPFILFMLAQLLRHRHSNTTKYLFSLILLLINFVLTFSRTGIVALMIGIVFLLLLVRRYFRRASLHPYRVFFSVASTILVILGLLSPLVGSRKVLSWIISGYSGRLSYFSTDRLSRMSLITYTLKVFYEHGPFGVGQGELSRYAVHQAHNTTVEMFAENGFLGLGCLVAIFVMVVSRGLRLLRRLSKINHPYAYDILGMLTGYIALWVGLQGLSFLTAPIVWFMTGMNLQLYWIVQSEQKQSALTRTSK